MPNLQGQTFLGPDLAFGPMNCEGLLILSLKAIIMIQKLKKISLIKISQKIICAK